MPENPAETVIYRFGSRAAVARALNEIPRPRVRIGRRTNTRQQVQPQTIRKWVKAGRIPAHWHEPLLRAAREFAVALDPDDLIPKREREGA